MRNIRPFHGSAMERNGRGFNGGEADIVGGCGFQPQYLQVNFRVTLRLEAATILKMPSKAQPQISKLNSSIKPAQDREGGSPETSLLNLTDPNRTA